MNQFVFPIKVYTKDTDYGGVVYHSNYLSFYEIARSEWAESLGFGIAWQKDHGVYFPVRSAQIDYLKPATLHDKLEVVSKLTKLGRASMLYDQYLRFALRPDTIISKATIKIACVDTAMRPRPLPAALFHELQEIQCEH
ncbi:MAG: YbgC/FadM family acyl-CoA thioesterase [Gammaproteobacteria bacterium]|nr:YbgC/FadM family acyl-CoA thioesterase [Gammaproteobacteria bacterium]